MEETQKVKKIYLQNLLRQLTAKKAFDSWRISEAEYEELFNEIIESLKKIKLEAKKKDTFKKLKGEIEEIINKNLRDFNMNFWFEFNKNYFNCFEFKIFPLRIYLKGNKVLK